MNTKNIFKTFFLCLSVISLSFTLNAQELTPLRLGVAGVSHGHLHEVLIRLERGDFEIVGVAEPDEQLRVNNPLRKRWIVLFSMPIWRKCWIRLNRRRLSLTDLSTIIWLL